MGNHPRTSAREKRALTARIATLVTLLTSSMLLLAPAASAQTAGDISVAVSATPDSLAEPGGDFTFAVVVGNPGGEDVTIDSLMDDTYGDLSALAGSNCGGLIGDVLAPSTTSAICTFTGEFTGVAGDTQTNTVTVVGTTAGDTEVTAEDAATVTITAAEEEEEDDGETSVSVRYAVSPSTRAEPGGTFHFGVKVTNTGDDEVELIALTDNVYGDLDGAGSCETGVLLDPDEEYTCTFEEDFTGDAGDTQTNTVTATVEDDGGDDATDTDSVEIAITEDSTTIDDGGGKTTIVVNNSSSSSSSAAAAASGGTSTPSPTPKPTKTLVRTGADSLPMGAGGLGLLALGSLLIVTAERERRRRLYGGSRL